MAKVILISLTCSSRRPRGSYAVRSGCCFGPAREKMALAEPALGRACESELPAPRVPRAGPCAALKPLCRGLPPGHCCTPSHGAFAGVVAQGTHRSSPTVPGAKKRSSERRPDAEAGLFPAPATVRPSLTPPRPRGLPGSPLLGGGTQGNGIKALGFTNGTRCLNPASGSSRAVTDSLRFGCACV